MVMAGIFTHCTFIVIVTLILSGEVKAQFFTVPIGQKPKPVQVEQQSTASDGQKVPYSEEISETTQGNSAENLPSSDCKGNAASHSWKAPSNNDGSRDSFSHKSCADSGNRHPNGRTRFSLPLRRIRITSPYGMRRHPIYKDWRFHNGIDLAANYEPVYAMLDGTVTEVGITPSAGKYVTLQHGPALEITYMHLSRIHVTKGDRVLSGDIVARSGNTGKSSSPHLHIKATFRRCSINPIHLLKLSKTIYNRIVL
ncbi:MAG: M23 family metallopeptidase [Erysipelotrichaceae bacterium]|nr:M23 family metallopeptidase [Erysipelotrichaceae bacterium]